MFSEGEDPSKKPTLRKKRSEDKYDNKEYEKKIEESVLKMIQKSLDIEEHEENVKDDSDNEGKQKKGQGKIQQLDKKMS